MESKEVSQREVKNDKFPDLSAFASQANKPFEHFIRLVEKIEKKSMKIVSLDIKIEIMI